MRTDSVQGLLQLQTIQMGSAELKQIGQHSAHTLLARRIFEIAIASNMTDKFDRVADRFGLHNQAKPIRKLVGLSRLLKLDTV
ncbi:Uncharacterised protein [Burkholderia pseudomallei]|nr:Uncharacterised protein [Burkholderia pseudomallei]